MIEPVGGAAALVAAVTLAIGVAFPTTVRRGADEVLVQYWILVAALAAAALVLLAVSILVAR